MNAFYEVLSQQSLAYSDLKETLGLSNKELIRYVKSQVIKDYAQENIIVNIPSRK